MILAVLLSSLCWLPFQLRSAAPCVRPTRAGTQVQGEVRVCPGRYRIADRQRARRHHRRRVGDPDRSHRRGARERRLGTWPLRRASGCPAGGWMGSRSAAGPSGGTATGCRIEGGRDHRITGTDLSGSRRQEVRSTPARPDSADRLDILRRDVFEATAAASCSRKPRPRASPGSPPAVLRTASPWSRCGTATSPITTWHRTMAGAFTCGDRRGTSSPATGSIIPAAASLRCRPPTVAPRPSCSATPATRTPSWTTISPRRAWGSCWPAARAAAPPIGGQPGLPQRRLVGPPGGFHGGVRLEQHLPGESRR